MPEQKEEWKDKLLKLAERMWEAGEGELVFSVFKRNKNGLREWKIVPHGPVERGGEDERDKIQGVG